MAAELHTLFRDLENETNEGNYEDAIKICDAILAQEPDDTDAKVSKAVCFVQLSKYDDALSILESDPELSESRAFERAYCMYQTKREAEALKVIRSADEQSAGMAHLEAQVLYRMGNFKESAKCFKTMVDADEDAETTTNALAAYTAAGLGAQALQDLSLEVGNMSTYEVAYNAACAYLDCNQLGEVHGLLQQAKAMCRETMESEEADEEEIQQEQATIDVQLAYLLQLQNKTKEAMDMYNNVLKLNLSDLQTLAVANNNIVAIRRERDLFDSMKKSKMGVGEKVEKRLSDTQKKSLHFNRALIAMHMNKADECKKQVQQLQEAYPDSELPSLVLAALSFRQKDSSRCINMLQTCASQFPHNSTRPLLSIAQLQLTQNSTADAIATLETIGTAKQQPGLVSAIVALCEQLGDIERASTFFDECIKAQAESSSVLTAAADFHMKHCNWKKATSCYSKLLEEDPRDFKAIAGMVTASSHFDPELCQRHEAMLPPLQEEEEVDAEELESVAGPRAYKGSAAGRAAERDKGKKRGGDDADADAKKKKAKKKRKIRWPKGYDADNPPPNPPDPERWLPKRERSTFRAKKKKDKNSMRGPQGAVAPTGESTPSPMQVEEAPPAQAQQQSSSSKKKKKKR